MRITKRQLRRIIRESILSEQKMLDIITSPYEDVEVFNILANYALNDDMQGALKDPTLKPIIDANDMDLIIDQSKNYIPYVGKPKSGYDAPPGWNIDDVYDFLEELEEKSYEAFSKKESGDHSRLPAAKERELIGQSLNQSYVMPDEIKGLEFQVRRKGGKASNINIEDERTTSNISADSASQAGFTLDDIIKVLIDGGAKERKKRAPIKSTPPVYD